MSEHVAQPQAGDTIVDLEDPAALDVDVVGTKAAALARAAQAEMRVLPAVVLTTAFASDIDAGGDIAGHPAVRSAFERMDGATSLVARSSSLAEDTAGSSMAGQFESVVGIDGVEELEDAVGTVLASRRDAGAEGEPIAVLVQPALRPRFGGVLFGVDPVSGRSDRLVVTAVRGFPEPLVSGEVEGSRYLLDQAGGVHEATVRDGAELPSESLSQLVELAHRVAAVFDGPQDVEWAIDDDGVLWLLQSRPVTTEVRGIPRGPVYGPGPVAETFPEPLSSLEIDMWVTPLREAVREAVRIAGTATDRQLEETDAVVAVGGHVAIDLRLAGVATDDGGWRQKVNLAAKVRHIRSAWRVGRLRSALPQLADELLDKVDADLEAVPPVAELTSRQLVALIRRGQIALRSLHAHEMLMALLSHTTETQLTAASVALRVLSEARREGLGDDEIVARSPVVLALTPPRVSGTTPLPGDTETIELLPSSDEDGIHESVLREALRLRVRWLQELTARAAWELGTRLTRAGALAEPDDVRHLDFDEVEAFATRRAVTTPELLRPQQWEPGDPLPARFRLSDRGKAVPVRDSGGAGGGTGAGGGRGTGPVSHDVDDPPDGCVLVTTTLTPSLGPRLPRLAGVVAETGSVLSHLAILARESRIPMVVGYQGATSELAEGTSVTVDGSSGDVTVEQEEGSPA